MKINVYSNLFIVGYNNDEYIEFNKEDVTVREVLTELTEISRDKINFIRNNNSLHEDYSLYLNGIELMGHEANLNRKLENDDTVKILIETLGG